MRIAELSAGSEAILYACETALKEEQPILLGLPLKCAHRVVNDKIYLCSLIEAEHDVMGFAQDGKNVLRNVNLTEMLNPVARGFRALKITPKL